MGMEDREWYREKRIDWERGGLTERKRKKRIPAYLFWGLGVAFLIAVLWFCGRITVL
jgi:hypothetical protein